MIHRIFFTQNFLGEKNSQKYFLEKKSHRNCFGGFDAQFLRFGEKISEKKSFSQKSASDCAGISSKMALKDTDLWWLTAF